MLLCNVAGEVYAFRNACPGSDLPLDGGRLRDFTLLCPWHNYVFDARTGKRLDGDEGRLAVIPVAIRRWPDSAGAQRRAGGAGLMAGLAPPGAGQTQSRRVLVAGFGNVLRGDDGFGVEVAQRLAGHADLPAGAQVMEVGIGWMRLCTSCRRAMAPC